MREVAGSAFWSYAGAIVERIVRFVVFVVIARLVTPADFGVVTLAALFTALLQDLLDAGIGRVLVRQQAPDDRVFDSAFWAATGIGAAISLGIFAVASAIAGIVRPPELAPVLQALSITPLIAAIGSIHGARLTRAMGFKAMSLRLIAASLVSGAVGVGLAHAGWGAWALVARMLVYQSLQTATVWIVCRWRPRRRFDAGLLRPLMPESARLIGSSALGQLNARGFDLIAGLALGAVALSTFRVAGQTVMLVVELTAGPISAVAFAALARHRGDAVRNAQTFLLLARISALLIFPAFFGLAATSGILFPLMFGDQWGEAMRIMPLLCLMSLPIHFQIMLLAALFAAGRADRMIHWQLAQGGATIASMAVGAPFGLTGVALAAAMHMYLLVPFGVRLMRRDTGTDPRLLIGATVPSLIVATIMGATVLVVRHLLAGHLSPPALLGASVSAGVLVWAAFLPATAGDLIAQARDAAAMRWPRRQRR